MAEDPNDALENIRSLKNRAPGVDANDPYENIDVHDLPDWWSDAVIMFRDYDLRPYRPPRFKDGVVKENLSRKLEDDYNIEIRFVCFNPQKADNWEILVDGNYIGEISCNRSTEGYSIFNMRSERFENLVSKHIERESI